MLLLQHLPGTTTLEPRPCTVPEWSLSTRPSGSATASSFLVPPPTLATGEKLGRPSLCGTSQLGWCVPGRLWDDQPLESSHICMGHPRRLGRPTRCGTSHAAGLSQFGWVVPVWLGCPSLAGVSQLRAIPPWGRLSHFTGSSQPCMGRPTRLSCPSLAAGCPSSAGVSQFGWGVPAAGHPTLARAVPFHWVIPVPLELLNVKGHSLLRCLTLTIEQQEEPLPTTI